jgi:hypothetical protein
MNLLKKTIFKITLEMLLNFLVKEGEKVYEEAKNGDKKKAYVVDMVQKFCKANGLEEYLDLNKLSKFIDKKVVEIINKS